MKEFGIKFLGVGKMINDSNNVPENTIVIVTEEDSLNEKVNTIVSRLDKKREWFNNEFYYCLPLTIGNQYGFGIKSNRTFDVVWSGKNSASSTKIIFLDEASEIQNISSHFGSGIITFQNRFHFRTPPGVNLITMPAPNYFIPGMQSMTGVIESDNLKKDFTFNVKLTIPNKTFRVNKGDVISCIMPIPRYYVDTYTILNANEVFDKELIKLERDAIDQYNKIRSERHTRVGPTKLYMLGKDQYGKKFKDHQKTIDKTTQK